MEIDRNSFLLRNLYSKSNPSNHTDFTLTIENNRSIYTTLLGLPRRIYEGANLLDLGCGSGFPSFTFAELGAKVTGVDFEPASLRIASSHDYSKFAYTPQFIYDSLDHYVHTHLQQLAPDIIFCSGVLHHLTDPLTTLHDCLSYLKPGSLFILGAGNRVSAIQHLLLKLVLATYKDRFTSPYVAATELFPIYFQRCVTYGHRSLEAVVDDQVLNPIHNYLSSLDVLSVVEQANCQILNRYPRFSGTFSDSSRNPTLANNEHLSHMLSDTICASSHISDLERLLPLANGIQLIWSSLNTLGTLLSGNSLDIFGSPQLLDSLSSTISRPLPTENELCITTASDSLYLLQDIKQILLSLDSGNISSTREAIKSSKVLFHGQSGLTMTYYLIEKLPST